MVFSRPGRRKLALLSLRSFLAQTWPRKELVIFNATNRRLLWLPRRSVKEIRLRARPKLKMLELCWENCNGAWCTFWWDDCVYEKGYLDQLLASAQPGTLLLLKNKTLFDKGLNRAFTTDSPDIVCPLFPRGQALDFSQEIVPQFPAQTNLYNDPALVVKVLRVLHDRTLTETTDCPA